ncbi:cupin-like domain-containing protein [Burkholderia singularis]|uniref:cupin-like domain-containing protein n=1 Tax=Burkholderia singularis TaxID=1503053 RepID=UPI0007580C3D|nr:cupin-like domain-containing protein [Burkholderia singularis]
MYQPPVSLPRTARLSYWLGFGHLTRYGKLEGGIPEQHRFEPSLGLTLFRRGERQLLEYCRKHVPEHVDDIPIHEIDAKGATPQAMAHFRKQQLPVLIKGGARGWRAFKEFSLNFFADHYGDIEVPVHAEPNQVFPDDGKPVPLKNFYQMSYVKMRDLVESIVTDQRYSAKAIEDVMHENGGSLIKDYCDLDYIHYLSGLMKYRKRWYFKMVPVGYVISKQLFMQSQRSHTLWHTEPGYNYFVAIAGEKDWRVASPYYSPGLYAVIKDNSTYHVSRVDGRESNEVIARRGFPLYQYMPKYKTHVSAGDILVLPPWWWHTVSNVQGSHSISLTFRTLAEPNVYAPMLNYLKWSDPNAKEIRRKVLSHGRLFDEDIAASLYAFADPKNDLRKNRPTT